MDLTVPGLLVTACATLATAVGKLWLDSKTREKEHDTEVKALQAELKSQYQARLSDQQAFTKALELLLTKRSESSRPASLTKTG